ncbi:MAG TPA: shikimate dehydrogenase [Alphaproteobacteria bacterium]|nr:shikimate dehydrogenase [Alphaproteobacteria bacterium]HNS45065.1 shikimate dehydrogenase [Alphaproteobacteria bacterium]
MIKTGVIGFPIEHSKSPLIHGYWLKKYSISGSYDKFAIEPSHLKEGVQRLVDAGLSGFNVTIPHKQTIMDLCCSLTESAQKIGAVNMVSVREDRTLEGDNTDSFGFAQNVRETLPDFDLIGKTALVLGAGGAARAVIDALYTLGASRIAVVNRTAEKAQELARSFSCEAGEWDLRNDLVGRVDFIVNTTSLGMKGQAPLEIDLSAAHENVAVADIVYAPLETELLRQASGRGLQTITGIGMLLHQARPAFAKWFGVMPDVDAELQKLVLG